MAALNFSQIADITPYTVNTTMFENSANIVSATQSMGNDVSSGWMWFILTLAIYIVVFVLINDKEGQFRLDFLAANVFASGMGFIISGVGLILGFSNSYSDVSFFGTLFFIFVFSKYLNRAKP